jgi:hypothetical protein
MEKRRKRNEIMWLGRQDSNLGMAESKSAYFPFKIKAHSEKIAKFDPLPINWLAAPFGMRPCGNSPVNSPKTSSNSFQPSGWALTRRAATQVASQWRSLKIQSGNNGPLTNGL